MIDPDFLAFDKNGLYCREGDFYLDPQEPVKNAVISHAHGDHARSGNTRVYCTAPTRDIMQLRFKKNAAINFYPFSYHQQFNINGVGITFFPAGHILGSAQVLMEFKGMTYLYTGDFKLQPDATCEPLEFVKADVLITESTFANPLVQHPDPVSEIQKLNAVHHNILLGAYSLGKSQRIIKLINQFCPERRILVHHTILPINKVYEKFAFNLGSYQPYNRKLMKQPVTNYVYIVPPLTFDSYFRAKNVLRVFASGWKNLMAHNDLELLISDHADWKDILKMVTEVKPAEIWTLHGEGKFLKEYFSESKKVKILQHAN
ncbi:MBL fold metallo-hydrolase [Rubrolithibacter danxiaensis]|uniref:MBL fold metallo-hydrolase n=1 Tax=Rubrolithibacter danxiaensis TaxID=3390805 RepID=UPI003BF7DE71